MIAAPAAPPPAVVWEIPFGPHAGQRVTLDHPARIKDISCGRRWGKTAELAAWGVRQAIDMPASRGWFVAPIFKQLNEVWEANSYSLLPLLRTMERRLECKLIADYSKTERRIRLGNDAVIEGRTGESDENLRGPGLHWLGTDETGQLRESAWFGCLYPTLSDYRGKALRVGTPRGRNWWYREWRKGQDGLPGYGSWQMPSNSRPNFPADMWEEAQRDMPADLFRQEYLAEFLETAAEVFPGLDGCLIAAGPEAPRPGRRYVAGLDWARKHDFTVLVILDVTDNPRVVWMERLQTIGYDAQASIIVPILRKYGCESNVWADETGPGDAPCEMLELRGIPVHRFMFNNTTKSQLIARLRRAIELGEIKIPNVPPFTTMVGELRDFDIVLSATGREKYGAPEGLYDDCVVGLALSVWGMGLALASANGNYSQGFVPETVR